ncbi:DNA polymerase III subunit gamma/tau [Polymorphobacter sp. PAMC 29334]|uniref:DNA polymerase III subunit gamma/tau n=1 Tax=Polymorphobacter sp. PAMC 29334 TaxID=2862331 RepID=UPI001C776C1A|nr:DNA polymerase III subunit gamma/tau [Polymorphobacter sp. PAMC 29334]QYE36527.1 DNA polymerase III subunit gamma/tau [Polymorphobacter sp. PAMC 29334]
MSELFAAAAEAPAAPPAVEYRVLARKYRPGDFASLLGQEAMVRTLGNAIARGQLAQAWLLTGVRGVGKTSTARIIAKALNCIGPDGTGGPTIAPCGVCEPCVAIAAGRHIDVIEMDAASNTGVDDVREIIEAVRYASVSARYKIYIVDEVHMLSKNAFNALLKTLEEPPPHVKFIFATTEVGKLPVTVLSRCQRFDLRRIPSEMLADHFARIVALEDATAEPEALALIARAAEGSVRDGLSILDQAIAHGAGAITAVAVRDMLGLSDRGAVRSLMALLLAGEAASALSAFKDSYDLGTDPAQVVQELLELVHTITRFKVADADDAAMSAEERAVVRDWATRLSFPNLHRLWQLLLKGLAEVHAAPVPVQAAEMALLRIIHASSLPDPGELVRKLTERGEDGHAAPALPHAAPAAQGISALSAVIPAQAGTHLATGTARGDMGPGLRRDDERGEGSSARSPIAPPAASAPPAPFPTLPTDYPGLVALMEESREPRLAHVLHDVVRLVDYAPPTLTIVAPSDLGPGFAQQLMLALGKATGGTRWTVTLARDGGAPTLHEQAEARIQATRDAAMADPLVRQILAAFPDATLLGIDAADPDDLPHRNSADA